MKITCKIVQYNHFSWFSIWVRKIISYQNWRNMYFPRWVGTASPPGARSEGGVCPGPVWLSSTGPAAHNSQWCRRRRSPGTPCLQGQGGSVRGFHTFEICFILLKHYNASLEQEERLFDTYQLGMCVCPSVPSICRSVCLSVKCKPKL